MHLPMYFYPQEFISRQQTKKNPNACKNERKSKQKDFSKIHVPVKQVTDLAGLVFVLSLQHSLGKSTPSESC